MDADGIYLALAGINATIYAILGGAAVVTGPHWNEERYRIEAEVNQKAKAMEEEIAKRSNDKTKQLLSGAVTCRSISAYDKWIAAPRAVLPFGYLKSIWLRRRIDRSRTALEVEQRELERLEVKLNELKAELRSQKRTHVDLEIIMSRHYLLQRMLDQLYPLLAGGIILPLVLVGQSYDDRYAWLPIIIISLDVLILSRIHQAIIDLSFGPDKFGKKEVKIPFWRRVLRRPRTKATSED